MKDNSNIQFAICVVVGLVFGICVDSAGWGLALGVFFGAVVTAKNNKK